MSYRARAHRGMTERRALVIGLLIGALVFAGSTLVALRSSPDEPPVVPAGESESPGKSATAEVAADRTTCTKRLALTFDDGPRPAITRRFVALLRKEQVPATFFMIGSRVARHPGLARFVSRSGFLVGLHGYRHVDHASMTPRGFRSSVTRTAEALRAAGVAPTPIFRFPYGSRTPEQERILGSMGYGVGRWTFSGEDAGAESSDAIVSLVRKRLERFRDSSSANVRVLLHDGAGTSDLTLAALPEMIDAARDLGFCFVPMDASGVAGYPRVQVTVARVWCAAGETRAVVRLSQPAGRRTRLWMRLPGLGVVWPAAVAAGRVTHVETLPDGARGRLSVKVAGAQGVDTGAVPASCSGV